jgi:selenide,water dikinase
MAKASNVTFKIDSQKIPYLPDVLDLISQGMLTRGDKNNRVYVGETITFSENVKRETQSAMFDPQTAGGLLISLESEKANQFLGAYPEAVLIGEVIKYDKHLIEVL